VARSVRKTYYVYILASRFRGATYIGVTGEIHQRLLDHRAGKGSAYATKWNITYPVHLEEFQYVNDALLREAQLKKWRRQWKFDLIETHNPNWNDLTDTLAMGG